jgi:hypothetical protein
MPAVPFGFFVFFHAKDRSIAERWPVYLKECFMKRTLIQAIVSRVQLSLMSIAFGEAGLRFEYPVYSAL